MKTGGIYKIQNALNGKLYVGSAVNFAKRFGQHLRLLRSGAHHSVKLQRAWNKYGSEAFSISEVEFVDDLEKLIEREQYWIERFDAVKFGYNMTPTAGSLRGMRMSSETKEMMSKAATGHIKSPEHRKSLSLVNTGKKMSDEARQKMREAKLGKKRAPHSLATRAKMSAARMGCKPSKETVSKMAASKLGKKQSAETLEKRSNAMKKTMHAPGYINPAIGRKLTPESIAKREATKAARRALQ